MGQMDGKVAIVTGSGRGIGKEIALRLVRDGASVMINDIDDAPAQETVAEIVKMGGKAVACNGDVAKPDFGDRIVKTAVDAFGGCHVVVNNAGYTWDSVIQKMSDEQWYAILDVHLTAPFRILRAFQIHLKEAVEKERAAGKRIVRKVVNISSTSGVNGNAGQSNYSAGKAGIIGLTKTLAKEFGRYDVTVNAVAFGYIQTRLTKPLSQGESGEIEDRVPEMVQALQTVDPGPQPLGLLVEAEPAQHREPGWLQQQAGPGRFGFGEALEDGDAMAGIGEQRRRRLAGDTASDDADLDRSNGRQRPPLTTRHWPLT